MENKGKLIVKLQLQHHLFDLNFTNQFSLNSNASFYIFSRMKMSEVYLKFKKTILFSIANLNLSDKYKYCSNIRLYVYVCNIIWLAVLILIIFNSFGREH